MELPRACRKWGTCPEFLFTVILWNISVIASLGKIPFFDVFDGSLKITEIQAHYHYHLLSSPITTKTKDISFRQTEGSKGNVNRIWIFCSSQFLPTFVHPNFFVFKNIHQITGNAVSSLRNIYFTVKMEGWAFLGPYLVYCSGAWPALREVGILKYCKLICLDEPRCVKVVIMELGS